MSVDVNVLANWNQPAVAAFKESSTETYSPDDLGGKSGETFARDLTGVDQTQIPTGKIKRSEVFALAADPSVNPETVCAAALAWGGMNMRFHHKLFAMASEGWLEVADGIRKGDLDREAAYDAFADLRASGKLYGIGPAYFTKLIYFLTPRSTGHEKPAYIMDQWAGCSINLLAGEEIVLMDVTKSWRFGLSKPVFTFVVSNANTGANYEAFCAAMDRLSRVVGLAPDDLDRALLASGGKKKSKWRQYVIDHRVP